MKILVTGGTGLVGQAMQQISPDYHEHEFIFMGSGDCDLLDFPRTVHTLVHLNPEVVIHLAANVGGLFKNMNQKLSMFEDNLQMNINMVRACHAAGTRQFVGMLSTCIFPDKTSYPIDETMLHEGPPHQSNDAYAYAKRMLHVHCEISNEYRETSHACMIPTNIYGEYDNYNLQDSHVIPALIHKCYLAKEKQQDFIVSGSGEPLRQFVYAPDLARAIVELLPYTDSNSTIIAMPDETEYSIGDVARMIAREFDYESRLKFDTTQSDGQYKKTASNRLFKQLLPKFNHTSIEHGLKSTVKHFINNYPNNIRL